MSDIGVVNAPVIPNTVIRNNWTPKGGWAWLLTASASLLTVASVILAYCMIVPVRWDGLGLFGAVVLIFPLHLLMVSFADAVLAVVAKRSGARLAVYLFAFMAVLKFGLSMVPTVAIWRTAQQLNVPLSISNYVANAVRVNLGHSRSEQSVIYGTSSDGTNLKLDVWKTGLPNSGPLRPAIVIVHGGAWIHGTRSMLPEWDRWFNELGYEVFDVEYRMPPLVRRQAEVGDVKAALGWVVAHAKEYHVDPTRITLMGNSAGGNLAMLAAYTTGHPDLSPSTDVAPVNVRSVISLYGPSDLALLYGSTCSLKYVRNAMNQYIGGTLEEFPDRYRLLSPVNHVCSKTPPTLMIHGTHDRLVGIDQAKVLDQALSNAGVAHEVVLLSGNDHVFDTNWGGFATQIARARIRAFLEESNREGRTEPSTGQ